MGVSPHCDIGYLRISGFSSVWSERSLWEREVAGSNPVIPTRSLQYDGGIGRRTVKVGDVPEPYHGRKRIGKSRSNVLVTYVVIRQKRVTSICGANPCSYWKRLYGSIV